jgi:chromosome segregation ATPase
MIIILILGIATGFGIEYALTQSSVNQLNESISSLKKAVTNSNSTIEQLQSKLNSTELALSDTREDLIITEAELSRAIKDLRLNQTQLTNLQQRLQAVQTAINKLDNDRLLLGELRKDIPTIREDARLFWEGLKTRADKVDSTLGALVDDILSKLDNYFINWIYPLGNATTTTEIGEIVIKAINLGALDYRNAIDKFQKEALLQVIKDMDQLISLPTK